MAGYKGNVFSSQLLGLILENNNIAALGDGTGLRGSTVAGFVYVALHASDPGAGGDQTTNEVSYPGYARVAVARSPGSWNLGGASISPTATIYFPPGTGGGPGTATFFSIGRDATGTGVILYAGPITPNVITGLGAQPSLATSTAITEA